MERGWQATVIKAKGAYSGRDQDILMTITNNIYIYDGKWFFVRRHSAINIRYNHQKLEKAEKLLGIVFLCVGNISHLRLYYWSYIYVWLVFAALTRKA